MRRPTLAPLVAVVLVVVLLLGGYMGAYYAMLDYGQFDLRPSEPTVILPVYRGNQKICGALFWPAHQLDRYIQPDRWTDH